MRGFTLLETLVAVTILMMTVIAPMTIAQGALQNAIYARDQVTAFYLAQEGVEYVRAVRDKNIMTSSAWLAAPGNNCGSGTAPTSLSQCTTGSGFAGCSIDFANFCNRLCPTTGCPPLLFSATAGYGLVTGTAGKYTRTVQLESVGGATNQYKIKVNMKWKSGRYDRQFDLEEIIMDWYN